MGVTKISFITIGSLVTTLFLLPLFVTNLRIANVLASDVDVLVVDDISSMVMIRVEESLFATSLHLLAVTFEVVDSS